MISNSRITIQQTKIQATNQELLGIPAIIDVFMWLLHHTYFPRGHQENPAGLLTWTNPVVLDTWRRLLVSLRILEAILH